MKKKMMMIFVLFFGFILSGCSLFTLTFNFTSTSTIYTTLPTTINGTISLGDVEYSDFFLYHSDSYDITEIDQYNDLLLSTRDVIRRSNILVTTTVYEYTKQYPWSTTTVLSIQGVSQGSGFIFLEDDDFYYALTNYHVVDGEGDSITFEVKAFEDEGNFTAELVAFDMTFDLAVLKFAKENRTDIHVFDVTSRMFTKFNVGELVLAVGNPLSLENNVTFGEFKAMETISNAEFKVIYHDAPIHEGSSGGALVDIDGNLMGINTWGLTTSDEYSFAIPNYIIYMFLINYGIL